ncbi:unnamed protein product [Ceratitis capitata]|uniref:(Mediterranean fruit fly) hypothetical protein n=1 Tax=Ceratitis capitata TaxID=7213 RepID=A0A811V5A2_CERCA|nr:unnamed protein product [Ceratitis capitata]
MIELRFFRGVMLVLMSVTYSDKLGHFECSPNCGQLLCLHVFWMVFDFYLFKKMDQRTCIKFCVKNEIMCAEVFRMLTVAYGEATLDRSNVYRWYKMFSEGREDVNDGDRAGRPSTSTTVKKLNEVEEIVLPQGRTVSKEYYLQVSAIYAERSARNARICGRTKIGFRTTITPLLTHRCLCATFWPKTAH